MKAAILKSFGTPLAIEDLPEPEAGNGQVVVDVAAAGVLHYMDEVISGARQYAMTLPMAPGAGAVGRVRAVGPDATRLKVGEWVLCDPTVRSRDDARAPDITLLGLSARGEGGLKLQSHYRHGTWAERVLMPTENVFPLGEIEAADAGRWCGIGLYLVPYGGLLAIDLKPGETLLVSGATGSFGGAGVAVALAMGAGCVVAPGRNERALERLERRFGQRVRTVRLTGDEEEDTARMKAAAPGSIDGVLDLLPPSAPASVARAAAMTVREYGRVVLMGGVGMLGGEDLALPYPWIMRNNITVKGQWMYPPAANTLMINLVRAGLLDISARETAVFPLAQANEAVAHAASKEGRRKRVVICP